MSKKTFQYFLIFIAVLTLNSSVDIPDYLLYKNDTAQNNSSFNEIESVAELVCEHVLDIHGQFPDKKSDAANHHHHSKKITSTKFADKRIAFLFTGFSFTEYHLPVFRQSIFTDFTKEILSPPPQLG